MNPLERSLIEKAGYANGWENVRESTPERVALFSARHKAEAVIGPASDGSAAWEVEFPKGPPVAELARSFSVIDGPPGHFQATGEAALGRLLRRAAELAMSLPNHAADAYAEEVAKLEAQPPSTTEALRLTKQRVGQDLFRKALMDYWGGACAVSGLHLPELLRASHAKPWADCATDAERLDVFNGFLLSAQLDSLFDSGLITFDDVGTLVTSPRLDSFHLMLLGLSESSPIRLRWISPQHHPYLTWHREHVFQQGGNTSKPIVISGPKPLHRLGEHEFCDPDHRQIQIWAASLNMEVEEVVEKLLRTPANRTRRGTEFTNGRIVCLHWDLDLLDLATFEWTVGLSIEEIEFSSDDSRPQPNRILTLALPRLQRLVCNNIGLVFLDLSGAPLLSELHCDLNALRSLDLSRAKNLVYLSLNCNPITALDFDGAPQLQAIEVNMTEIENLDISSLYHLEHLSHTNCLPSKGLIQRPDQHF
jgi:hypothetical protein